MEPSRPRIWSRTGRIGLDPVLVLCVAVLLGFPVLAALVARGLPVPPREPRVAVPAAAAESRGLRPVPVFAQEPDHGAALESPGAMRAALRGAMEGVLEEGRAARLLALVSSDRRPELAGGGKPGDPEGVPYPYRYPRIERLLPAELGEEGGDLGALLILAAGVFGGAEVLEEPFPNAGYVAFAVLDRARAGGACEPQLNLAFALSADRNPFDDQVEREYARAMDACGDDPTPRWLLSQFQSQRAFTADNPERPGQEVERAERLRRPVATAQALQRSHPGLAAGWTAEADAELRIGYQLELRSPFGARQRFRRALALYRAARRVDDGPETAHGEARALAALHDYDRAADVQSRAAEALDGLGPAQARLVEYLERAGRFAAAAEAASALITARVPETGSLLMRIAHDDGEERLIAEDAEGPLSTGASTMRPVRLDIGPLPGGAGGPGADLSFLPLYRDVGGVTGYDRWCPDWARRRDLILAGRPREALESLPRRFKDVDPYDLFTICVFEFDLPMLEAVALVEAGDRAAAVDRLREDDAESQLGGRQPGDALREAQQNLWRFAGDYERAGRVVAAWLRDGANNAEVWDRAEAMDRAGEIAFLEGRHADAARWFGREALAARGARGVWSATEARAQLKRGTALTRLGRRDEALAELEQAEQTASRAGAFARGDDDYAAESENEFLAYHALAQAGDAALLAERYDVASELYASAADQSRFMPVLPIDVEPLARLEVLFNNWALADAMAGRPRTALAAARRAVATDPANPLFRDTEGLALQELGRTEEAARAYRAAVGSEPTDHPAWNNLGVTLAETGHEDGSTRALRRAVGAREDYALGWFNLGVALEERGLWHAIGAQGALGRAIRLDGALRDREHELVADEEVYVTNLDLSKPLPPEWSFSETQDRAPVAAAGFALALLLGLRLTRSLSGRSGSAVGERLFAVLRTWIERVPPRVRYPRATIAVVATVAVFAWPLVRAGTAGVTGVILLVLGCLVLIAAVTRARTLAARRAGVALEQRTWSPGVAFGLVAGALGAPWAPLPVARTTAAADAPPAPAAGPEPAPAAAPAPAPAVHLVGPVLTGVLALALLILGIWLEVPVTRSLGAAALVMSASMLTPIDPLDGAAVAKTPVAATASFAFVGAVALMAIGLQ